MSKGIEFSNERESEIFFNQVYRLYSKGKIDEALAKLDLIKEGNPEYPHALFYKSMMLPDADEDDALDLFRQALTLQFKESGDVGDSDLLFDFSDDYYDEMQELSDEGIAEAGKTLDFISKLQEEEVESIVFKAVSQAESGNLDDAIDTIAKAIQLNPDEGGLWIIQGVLCRENDDYEKALECYDTAYELDSSNQDVIVGKARVYIDMGEYGKAQKLMDSLEDVDEDDFEYIVAMGFLMWGTEKLEEALFYFDRALEIQESVDILLYKAIICVALNDDEGFEDAIDRACEIDPDMAFKINEFIDGDDEFL